MKTHLKKSLEMLDKYLKETPVETLEKELASFKLAECEGPTLDQYVELFNYEFWGSADCFGDRVDLLNGIHNLNSWVSVSSKSENQRLSSRANGFEIKLKKELSTMFYGNLSFEKAA